LNARAAKTGRVGIEIEFSRLTAHEAAEVIAAAPKVGGKVVIRGPHAAHLEGGALDGARVELDTRFANPPEEGDGDFFKEMLEAMDMRDMAADAVSYIAPVELSTPPMPVDKLDVVDAAIAALRDAGGVGTKESPFAAYGLHLNVELVPPDPQRAVRVAAAYAFAEEWVRWKVAPDLMRRATPYVDPYPAIFTFALSRAFDGKEPDLKAFIALYGRWCPSRNHGLDMWPLLGWLDEKTAKRATIHRIRGPRPTFHYRLPNSDIEDPEWTPRNDLALWRKIEQIGDDPKLLEAARTAWVERNFWRITGREYRRRFDEMTA